MDTLESQERKKRKVLTRDRQGAEGVGWRMDDLEQHLAQGETRDRQGAEAVGWRMDNLEQYLGVMSKFAIKGKTLL